MTSITLCQALLIHRVSVSKETLISRLSCDCPDWSQVCSVVDDLWLTWDLDIRKSHGHFLVEKLLVVVLALDIRVQVAVVVGAYLVVRVASSLVDGAIFLAITTLVWHNRHLVTHSRRSSNLCLYLSLQNDCISFR